MQQEINRLWREIEFKDKKIEALDASRVNTLDACKQRSEAQKKKIEELQKACEQMRDMSNSILTCLARKNGGEIRIPADHLLEYLNNPAQHMTTHDAETHEYVFTVMEDKE